MTRIHVTLTQMGCVRNGDAEEIVQNIKSMFSKGTGSSVVERGR